MSAVSPGSCKQLHRCAGYMVGSVAREMLASSCGEDNGHGRPKLLAATNQRRLPTTITTSMCLPRYLALRNRTSVIFVLGSGRSISLDLAARYCLDNISLGSRRWVLEFNLMGLLHGIRIFVPMVRAVTHPKRTSTKLSISNWPIF